MVLAGGILLAAAALFLWGVFSGGQERASSSVIVTAAGSFYGRYPLAQDAEVIIENPYGRNVLRIQNGQAFMAEADCDGGDCLQMQPIGTHGGTIVCLPHRVVVSLEQGTGMNVDVVVR